MNFFFTVVLTFHVLVAAGIIGLVLVQHGKGADMGAAFGSGSSGSLFGATGSANFLSRTTAVLATVFFLSSIALSWLASHRETAESTSIMRSVREAPPVEAPSVPGGSNAPSAGTVPAGAAPSVPPGGVTPPSGSPATPKSSEVPK